jgi:phosphatidylglycerophosphate synthase
MHKPGFAALWSRHYAAGGPPATWWFSQYLGALFAWGALRLGASPTWVTLAALATMIFGCALYATGPLDGTTSLLCLALLQLSYGLDCADGQVARASGRTSEYGAWLDVFCDFIAVQLLTFAMLGVLLRSGFSPAAGIAASLLWACGRTTHLYTATRIRLAAKSRLQTSGKLTLVRLLLTTLTDTPVVLLVLALLRNHPAPLALAAAGFGGLSLAHAIYVAEKTFPRAGARHPEAPIVGD